MIKAVIFDLDGTLVDTNKIHLVEFRKCFKQFFGLQVSAKEILPLFGESIAEIARLLLSKHHKTFSKKQINGFTRVRMELYARQVKGKHLLSKATFNFLKKLKAKGLKLAIASGSYKKMLNASLRKSERKLFNAIVCADDVKHAKPHPQLLELTVKRLRMKRKECLYVGDGLLDALASKNAGLKFAAVLSGITSRKEFKKLKPVTILKGVKELGKVLGKL